MQRVSTIPAGGSTIGRTPQETLMQGRFKVARAGFRSAESLPTQAGAVYSTQTLGYSTRERGRNSFSTKCALTEK